MTLVIAPFVGSLARDHAPVGRKQLGFSSRTSIPATGARETPGIRVLGPVKGHAVQPPVFKWAKSGRSEGRFRSGRVVETSNEPSSTVVSREDTWLAIVISSDDGVLRGPNEDDWRKSGHLMVRTTGLDPG